MLHLALDFETSGKFDFKLSPTDLSQPRPTQVGAVLTNDQAVILAQLDIILRPDGVVIDDETAAYTGITNDAMYKYGLNRHMSWSLLKQLVTCSDVVVCHNAEHEKRIAIRESAALCLENSILKDKETFCTMLKSTDICKIPHAKRRGNKWPKLQEAVQALFKVDATKIAWHGAHTDALWTSHLYHYLRSGIVPDVRHLLLQPA